MANQQGGLTNGQIYRKTFIFSWMRFLVDFLAVLILAACILIGFFVSGQQVIGLGIGLLVGILIFFLMVHFVTYLFKAGQIAMMTKGVTEGQLPDNVLQAGKAIVKQRFLTVAAYYAVTSAIKAIFREITRGINAIGKVAGGETGGEVGDTISGVINTVVSYLCDCCLGWVFYKSEQSAFKSTCDGAVLFFKNWKALIKNLGRIFGMGLVSLLVIGGAFTAMFYAVLGNFPAFVTAVAKAMQSAVKGTDLSDPTVALLFVSLLFGVIVWTILHNAFVRPFVLVGVLRNYMTAGIQNPPQEESFAQLDKLSPKFRKTHAKANG